VWLGLALLVASFGLVGLALRSHAGDGTRAGNADSPPSRPERRAVAIAHVDAEGGVTSLYPLRPGRVAEVYATEGQAVSKGDKLFRMVDTLEKAQVEEAEIAVKAAEEKLAQAQQMVTQHEKNVEAGRAALDMPRKEAEAAKAVLAKARRFYEKALGGTKEDVSAAEASLEKARAAVRAGEAKLAALEAIDPQSAVRLARLDLEAKKKDKEKADFALRECVVRAPVDGTVLRSQVQVGEVLGPNPKQPALVFCPGGPRIVRAEVEQEFANRVYLNQPARIQDDATGGGDWRGKVSHISDWYSHRRSVQLEPMQFYDVRTLEVIIKLDPSSKARLRIGQRVRVTLEGKE
jgi:multidrug resistance efflux pump